MKGPLPKIEKEPCCEQEGNNMCNHTTFEEAKNSCMARKRKERQESVSSISQERKVIRSSSEERPVRSGSVKSDIKRVSSLEDVKKVEKKEENSFYSSFNGSYDCSPSRDSNVQVYEDFDDHEKRRSHERFARPLAAQRGRRTSPGKKPKTRQFSKIKYKSDILRHHSPVKHGEDKSPVNLDNLLQLHGREERQQQRTPSPEPALASPTIDLSTLHEQIDCSEPMLSSTSRHITEETETLPSALVASNRLLLSPRNSIIMSHRIYLDPEVPLANSLKKCKNPVEQRLKELTKQMNNLKRKIKKQEEEFEGHFGYKPSHADKMNDKGIRQLYGQLNQVRKEQKQLKEDSSVGDFESGSTTPESMRKVEVKLQDTLIEIEKRMSSREASPLDQMSNEQLMDEKIAMQKALLYLESLHGRPTNKEDRDLVRPLYDKYRSLKRLISKTVLLSGGVNELQTIHEDETMDFVSSPPAQLTETDSSEKTPQTTASTDSDTDTSISENLHSLNREELMEQQKVATEEKKRLRRCLKQFEMDVELKTGRKVQKDDKLVMEGVYVSYKKTKAKLRLLDALLNKQKSQ